jgi:phosphopantetheinyl transferase (holo-ACP synthase)
MSKETVVIIDGDVITEREMTKAELEQLAKDKAENKAFLAEMLPKEQAAKEARQTILDKLGLSQEEMNILLGNG